MDKKSTDNAITRQSLYGTTPEPTYAGVLSFSRRKYTRDLDGVDLVISGVPLDTATTNRPGARFGPRAIRAASTIMAWEKPYGLKFDPFDKLAVIDYGDCFLEFGRPQNVPAQIEEHAWKIIDRGPGLLSLGGDHFVAYPLLKAHARKHGAPLSLLHFDAHSDTWEDEEGRIDHGTMFFHAVKEGLVDPATSVQIGLRTQNDDTLGFNVLDGPWVHENGIGAVIRQTRKVLGDRPVYLSFDIDCLDPSFAPGTGTPVCGGLSSYQAISILRGLAGINLVGMDVVEVAPAYDVGEITALAAAHLAMEMIGLYASRPDK
ncbi:MAG: agmatinase [Gammaproteobacteria bacterium]|nr:agmatinase [Gammaproteobacteria bacterium]